MSQLKSLTNSSTPATRQIWQIKDLYLAIVSLAGLIIIAWGLFQFPSFSPKSIFFLLALMAIVAQIANTSVALSDQAGITFEVGTAVSVAAIPLFGPAAAALIVALSSVSIWILKSHDKNTWKKSVRQLGFNTGMWAVSIYAAGLAFQYLQLKLEPGTIASTIIPWLMAAIITDQLNIWILLGMVRLQHGPEIHLIEAWRENRWASGINILIISVGGGFLAFAASEYNWMGTAVFFLPIFLSGYAFALYVRQMSTHMENLEHIIARRTEELSDVMREKDAFLAVLTHDMKTPLTTIGLYAEMLTKRPDILEKKPHLPEVIKQNQQKLMEIVNNILDLEKLQVGGTLHLSIEPFDLATCLEYLLDSLSVQADQKEITVDFRLAETGLMLEGDRKQIERAFQNLLSNAIKYTPERGHVFVEASAEGEQAVIHIQDNGYGIPEDELPYVFDRFRRVAKHQKVANGTGLGLSITKAIVEAHGGTTAVSSQEGEGTTFTVWLPLP